MCALNLCSPEKQYMLSTAELSLRSLNIWFLRNTFKPCCLVKLMTLGSLTTKKKRVILIALCLEDLSRGGGWGGTYMVLLHRSEFTNQLHLLTPSKIFKVDLQLKTNIVLWLRLNCSMWRICCKRSECKDKSGNFQVKRKLENEGSQQHIVFLFLWFFFNVDFFFS